MNSIYNKFSFIFIYLFISMNPNSVSLASTLNTEKNAYSYKYFVRIRIAEATLFIVLPDKFNCRMQRTLRPIFFIHLTIKLLRMRSVSSPLNLFRKITASLHVII